MVSVLRGKQQHITPARCFCNVPESCLAFSFQAIPPARVNNNPFSPGVLAWGRLATASSLLEITHVETAA